VVTTTTLCIGGRFKFQVQDSFLEYFFFEIWRFEKHIALSEKKPPLGGLDPDNGKETD
jgi:hypothetical protein